MSILEGLHFRPRVLFEFTTKTTSLSPSLGMSILQGLHVHPRVSVWLFYKDYKSVFESCLSLLQGHVHKIWQKLDHCDRVKKLIFDINQTFSGYSWWKLIGLCIFIYYTHLLSLEFEMLLFRHLMDINVSWNLLHPCSQNNYKKLMFDINYLYLWYFRIVVVI